jgi:outer membrane murein-binding lipoprotein Lpp
VRRLLLLIFFTLFGLGIGLVVGAIFMRRVDHAASKMSPENVAEQVVHAAATARERLRAAAAEASRAKQETEAQLRTRFRVPTVEEAARTGRRPDPAE